MIYWITAGFVNSRILKNAWPVLYHRRFLFGNQHWFLDNHYPLRREQNKAEILSLCEKFDVRYLDCEGDFGFPATFNKWFDLIEPEDTDIIITVDGNCRPKEFAWDHALVRALQDPKIAVAALWNIALDQKIHRGELRLDEVRVSQGVRYCIHPSVEMFKIAGWSAGFIRKAGGMKQLWKYYGGVESAMFSEWTKQKLHLAYLPDFHDEFGWMTPDLEDPLLREWKNAHLTGYAGSFKEWLIGAGYSALL